MTQSFPTITARGATLKLLSKGSTARGTALQYRVPAGFAGVHPHYHADTTEWFYVLAGSMVLSFEDQELSLVTGQYAQVAPDTVHAWRNRSATEPLDLLFGFDRPGMDGYFEELMRMVNEAAVWPPLDPSPLVDLGRRFDTFGMQRS